mgnify:CR=1 FL=1
MSEPDDIDPKAKVINLGSNSRVKTETHLVWPNSVTIVHDIADKALAKLAGLGLMVMWVGFALSMSVALVLWAMASGVQLLVRSFG